MTENLTSGETKRGPAGALRPEPLDCELTLPGVGQAVLAVGGREFVGRTAFDEKLRHELRKLSLDPESYGVLLFESLFPEGGELRAGFREALALARYENRRLCLRLHLTPAAAGELHELNWELLRDPRQRLALGRSREVSLVRYLSVPLAPGKAVVERPKVLVALAVPNDLAAYGLPEVETDEARHAVERAFSPLAARISYEILDGPASPLRIRDRLVEEGFHVLHLQAHGKVDAASGSGLLVLESEAGRAEVVDESLFAEIVEGDRKLRLVTLMSCHGGAQAGPDAFSGLAPALVRRGVPAVVAIRGAIPADTAALFSEHLYGHLVRWGRIDAAVNEARQKLHLARPDCADWSQPMLFMRLEDGLLWRGAGRGEPRSAADWKRELARVRGRRDRVRLGAVEREIGSLDAVDGEVAMDLYLSYRALEAWDDMIRVFERLSPELRRSVEAREQLAFALNRRGETREAIWLLEEILRETGPRHETCGLLGRAYKDLWSEARRRRQDGLARGYLDKAIAAYVQGFEVDWRDGYAGINALTLLDLRGGEEALERQAELLPLVRFAVKKKLESSRPGYWDWATFLELAVLAGDAAAAERSLEDALASVEESWQSASTANNLRMIRDGRRERGLAEPWLDRVIEELAAASDQDLELDRARDVPSGRPDPRGGGKTRTSSRERSDRTHDPKGDRLT